MFEVESLLLTVAIQDKIPSFISQLVQLITHLPRILSWNGSVFKHNIRLTLK